MTGEEFLKNYEELMMADTVGGATPEETLKMFVEALRAEDVNLAARYFLLDDEGKGDKWVTYLQEIKDNGLMQKLADDLGRAKVDTESVVSETDYNFVIVNAEGDVVREINMELNEFSGVWKIESL